ncbi:hypothetical protein CQJ94_10715 [Glycomyces fuscus]|nr:hypothetical protein CQJ94_10715 [Glycomyces fuscus]
MDRSRTMTKKTTTGTRLRGRAITALVAAASAVAVTAVPAAAQEAPRVCVSDDFKIIENDRRAAAGTAYVEFAMMRIGGEGEADAPRREPCSLYRELDVYWVDQQDRRVGAWAVYDGEPGEPFVLGPEETAVLTVAQPGAANYDPQVCEPTRVRGLQVGFDLGDGGVHAPTGGRDTVCANPEVGVPRYRVEPHGY